MANPKLKICGMHDPEISAEAIKLGVDYIGLIFHEKSPRNVSIEQAIKVATAVKAIDGHIVAVFVDQGPDEILKIADMVLADLIQLHGKAAFNGYADICKQYPCILADQFCQDHSQLDCDRDFLLYDNEIAGSGEVFDWKAISIDPKFKIFIAGGISSDNALAAINHFQPYALDVSSGVEISPGAKSLEKIKALITLLKSNEDSDD